MVDYSVEEFEKKCDSLYRLVLAGARRASQLSKPDVRPLVSKVRSKKPTMTALQEVLEDKVQVSVLSEEHDEFVE